MMEAPRWALSGLVLCLAVVVCAPAQDPAKAAQAEIKKVEDKIKEESDRVARKKPDEGKGYDGNPDERRDQDE